MVDLAGTRSGGLFHKKPWIQGLIVLIALLITLAADIPILGNIWFQLLMVVALIYFWFSEPVFKTLFIVLLLLAISNFFFLFLDASLDFDELERIESITRIVKAVSLFTIVIEGLRGAFFAKDLSESDQRGWEGVTYAGVIACLLCAIALIIFALPSTDAFLVARIPGSEDVRPLWLTMFVNIIAVVPIAIFLFGNWRVVNSKTSDKTSYIYGICKDYLCYVNMPGLIGSCFIFLFALILYSMTIPVGQIKLLISGGMTFLIFSAVLVGHLIEQRNRENEEAKRAALSQSPLLALSAHSEEKPA